MTPPARRVFRVRPQTTPIRPKLKPGRARLVSPVRVLAGWPFMTKPACPMCEMTNVLESTEKWERESATTTPSGARVVKDAHGNILSDGDCVILIKDLKLGGSEVLKGGVKSKPIRLVVGDHEISCKVNNIAAGLKACFVRKA